MSDDWYDDPDAQPPALGAVVEAGRGSLPFALIHGEALVACASWALGDSRVTPVDLGTEWAGLVDAGEPFVLHDALCPMTPAAFISRCVRIAVADDVVVAGVVSGADGSRVASPVVLPASVVVALDALPVGPDLDLEALVEALRAVAEVRTVEAPAMARRVASVEDLRALERETAR